MSKILLIKKPNPLPDIGPRDGGTVTSPPKPVILAKRPTLILAKPRLPLAGKPKTALSQSQISVIDKLVVLKDVRYEDPNHKITKGKTWKYPILSQAATAQALEVSNVTFGKWVKDGMVPHPVLKKVETPIGTFYHVNEVLVMAELFLDHRATFRYYRSDHTDLTQRLFRAVESVRSKLFL